MTRWKYGVVLGLVIAAAVMAQEREPAVDPMAATTLREMCDRLEAAKSLSFTAQITWDTEGPHKLQFGAVQTVDLRRPGHSARERVEEVTFTADREGKFRYRCSQTCGFLHPFMLGEFIVAPNRLLPTGISLAFGVLVGSFLVVLLRPEEER